MSCKLPGKLHKYIQKHSRTIPGHFPDISRNISQTCPGNVLDMSWIFSGHFLHISREILGHFLDISLPHLRTSPGYFPNVSRTCPGYFPGVGNFFPCTVLSLFLNNNEKVNKLNLNFSEFVFQIFPFWVPQLLNSYPNIEFPL